MVTMNVHCINFSSQKHTELGSKAIQHTISQSIANILLSSAAADSIRPASGLSRVEIQPNNTVASEHMKNVQLYLTKGSILHQFYQTGNINVCYEQRKRCSLYNI